MSAPVKDDTPNYVLNINTSEYKGETIISNASYTTKTGVTKAVAIVMPKLKGKLISSNFIGSINSSTYVPDMSSVVDGATVKVLAWYDNEWGYSSRLVDRCVFAGNN